MAAIKPQTLEQSRELIRGYEDGTVEPTQALVTNGKAAILAGKVRKFLADSGGSITGFETGNNLGNTYIHKLATQRQIQLKSLDKIAKGLGVSCGELFEQLVEESGGKAKKVAACAVEAADELGGIDISRVPGEPQLVLTDIPEVGTIIIGLTTKTVEFANKSALRRMLRG